MITVELDGKEYMLPREPNEQDWNEIHALNMTYAKTGDMQEWVNNISYLRSKGNPLAAVKLHILAEQRRQADDTQVHNEIKPEGNIYKE